MTYGKVIKGKTKFKALLNPFNNPFNPNDFFHKFQTLFLLYNILIIVL